MNLLVVGKSRETRALARLLRAEGRRSAAHFADHAAALAAVGHPGAKYDFVLVEEGENATDHRELAKAIRSRDRRVPIAILTYSEEASTKKPRLLGVFERSSEGLRALNCVLTDPPAGTEGNCACELGQIVFEYRSRSEQRS